MSAAVVGGFLLSSSVEFMEVIVVTIWLSGRYVIFMKEKNYYICDGECPFNIGKGLNF